MMNDTHIVRVWGTADEFDIEFFIESDGRWHCIVPPDIGDGQYAVELWAMNRAHNSTYWTGMLYMSGGVAHMHIEKQRYRVTNLLQKRINVIEITQQKQIMILNSHLCIQKKKQRVKIELVRGCKCGHA